MTARAGRVSDTVAAAWLAELRTRTTHLALMLADPYGVADPLTVEVAGSYTRVPVLWTTSSRLLRNTGAVVWAGIPTNTTIVAIAGFNSAFNGVMSFSCPYGPTTLVEGGGLLIAANDLFIGIDV